MNKDVLWHRVQIKADTLDGSFRKGNGGGGGEPAGLRGGGGGPLSSSSG